MANPSAFEKAFLVFIIPWLILFFLMSPNYEGPFWFCTALLFVIACIIYCINCGPIKSQNYNSEYETPVKKFDTNFTTVDLHPHPHPPPVHFVLTHDEKIIYKEYTERFILKHILYENNSILQHVQTTFPSSGRHRQTILDQNGKILEKILTSKYENLRHHHHGFLLTQKITWLLPPLPEMSSVNEITWEPDSPVACFQLERTNWTSNGGHAYTVYYAPAAHVIVKSAYRQGQIDHFDRFDPSTSGMSHVANICLLDQV